jgi:hypothetical protein
MTDTEGHGRSAGRRVLAKFVARSAGTTRAIFELGNGDRVEVEDVVAFDAPAAPKIGQKAFVVVDEEGRALRWEPYPGAELRRRHS